MKSIASSIHPSLAATSTRHWSRVTAAYQFVRTATVDTDSLWNLRDRDPFRDVVQKGGRAHAVDDAVIARERERQRGTHVWLPVDGDHPIRDCADREDPGLRRHDDRCERADAVHPEVADRERSGGDVRRLEAMPASTIGE